MKGHPSKQPTPESSEHAVGRQSKGNPNSTPSASDCRAEDHKSGDNDSLAIESGGECGFVELTLISAQGLKDVKMFGSMSPYAIVYIDPSCKRRTCISENTGSSPVWDYFLRLPIPAIETLIDTNATSRTDSVHNNDDSDADKCDEEDHPRLTIQIFSQGVVSDVLVGTAHIPLQDIIQNATGKLQYLACQLVRPSGRIQGLVNLSMQFTAPSLPHDLLHHLHSKGTCPRPAKSRNSWFFIAEGAEDGGTSVATSHQARPVAAPDFLDFKAEGEGAGTGGGVSRSLSLSNESVTASSGHAPISSHSGFLNVPLSKQPQQHHYEHQPGGSKAMFDSTFDAMVVTSVANDVAAISLLQPDRGSQNVGDALLGLAMSQPLQGNNAPFGPSS